MKPIALSARPVLIVDDDTFSLMITSKALQKAGLKKILTCMDSRQAMEMVTHHQVGMVFLDLVMPHLGGEELLQTLSERYPEILVIILTATEAVDTAVRCIQAGAFNYLTKPIDFERLFTIVKNALALQELQQENQALRQSACSADLHRPEVFADIVTHSVKMLQIFRYVESIAGTAEPVLITGETGVGKDLFAQAIHSLSNRRGALVAVNVAGLDDIVFSDTLFGHSKGAFTGAERVRGGLIEQASSGTLFLDEIGDLTATSQSKLLRLLQGGDYFPLGSDVPKHSDARVISATHRNLWQLAQQEKFRQDLNFRLRTHHLHIPPLRERLDDLPLLIEHFLTEFTTRFEKPRLRASKALIKLLEGYSFPGNIRELRMIVFDAATRTPTNTLSPRLLEAHLNQASMSSAVATTPTNSNTPLGFNAHLPTLKQATDLLIQEALRRSNGNQTAAAKLLGISQQALSKRLKSRDG
ncbi:MAG: sigma-54-dependent Fis family transcriptional regulator [Gammaproteobacteria bacterium]|nr:sigma-54-dependent Fis family transcriptional regulator [Gammaproteobacteria bacterium]MCP5196401.1 sigma-54-dependent Fis family transcriptional regulator [Gammaproteobacteria bacterium]